MKPEQDIFDDGVQDRAEMESVRELIQERIGVVCCPKHGVVSAVVKVARVGLNRIEITASSTCGCPCVQGDAHAAVMSSRIVRFTVA